MKKPFKMIEIISKKIALFGAIFFCFSRLSAQSDSATTEYSFGFDGTRVFNQLFRGNPYSSIVYGEYRFSERNFFRLAGDLEQNSGDDGKLDFQIKLGLKRVLKEKDSWIFYTGIDGLYEYEFNKNSEVLIHREGGLIYVGATKMFGPHFSLSTEPSIFLVFKQTRDFDSFSDEYAFSRELGLTHVGLVRATFHF